MLLVGGLFPQIYNTTDEIKSLATSFIAVSAIIMPFVHLHIVVFHTPLRRQDTGHISV